MKARRKYFTQVLNMHYPHMRRLGALLTKLFDSDYQLSYVNGNVVVETPRVLTQSERDAVMAADQRSHYERENEAIRTQGQESSRVAHLLPSRSSPRSTNDPSINKPPVAAAHQAKVGSADEANVEAFESNANPVTSNTSSIPFFDPTSREIPLVDIGTGFKPAKESVFKFVETKTYREGNERQTGLYSFLLEVGATSSVFGVQGYIEWLSDQLTEERVVQKCAVKKLNKATTPVQFWAEFSSLKRLKSLNHPHVVETLSAFRSEEDGEQHFNFMFPLALGNLKRLFRGDDDKTLRLPKRAQDSLWGQFAGLSSAVAYLHGSIRMAHRDIKPSNILIYAEPASKGGILLKLTDFGLSVDLSKARTWEAGSVARQSAWRYDSPEVRKASPNLGSKAPGTESFPIPSDSDLLANDIWKLGCVFTEMVAFLVCGGSQGVKEFRDYITTSEDRVESDVFYDTRFDDGDKVKGRVLDWLGHMARRDIRAGHLQAILGQMLAESSTRPSIEGVCKELVRIGFPNIRFDDGLRLVRFTPASQTRPLSRTESLQLDIEKFIGRRVDWSPFPRPRPKLRPDQFLMTWEWKEVKFYIPLSQNELNSYKPLCLPRTTHGIPLLPFTEQQADFSQRASTNLQSRTVEQPVGGNSQPPLGNAAIRGTTAQPSAAPPPAKPKTDMYWCFEKIFTESTENYLFTIIDSQTLGDDEDLYRQVNRAISPASGWRRWLSSWRRCTEVEFIEFCVVWTNQDRVSLVKTGLLPPPGKGYTHTFPGPEHGQTVLMAAAREQMISGLADPKRGKDETTNSMLPQKLKPPPLAQEMGEQGWGLHVKTGIVLWKFLCWMILPPAIMSLIFMVLWLVYINPTDLQNAFVPATIVTALLALGLAVIQMSEIRGSR